MSGSEINKAVARATGEDIATITSRGFTLLEPEQEAQNSDGLESEIVELDALSLERFIAMCG